MIKDYDDLVFTDDFLFCKILTEDLELCKEFTELILGRKINRIVSPLKQKTINVTSYAKGIRLDVCFEDDLNTVYDIEMQTSQKGDLQKRTRYYQGLIDLDLLEKGRPYEDLKESYIIFLCTFDPFKQGKHRYSFYNICEEDKSLYLEDGVRKIFFNTEGTENDVSPELLELLNYLKGFKAESEVTQKIETTVKKSKVRKGWRKAYMTYAMKLKEQLEEGIEIGFEKGITKGIAKGMEKGVEKGTIITLSNLVDSKLLTVEEAASQAKLSVEKFLNLKKEYLKTI